MAIPARIVFSRLLQGKKNNRFTADPVTLHKVFYELYLKNREIMSDFEFIKRINPFSPTLENLIQLFQLTGTLSRENPDFINYVVNHDRLTQIDDKDFPDFKLKGDQVLNEIFL